MKKNRLPLCLLFSGLTLLPGWANSLVSIPKANPAIASSSTNRIISVAADPIPANIWFTAKPYSRNSIEIKWNNDIYDEYPNGTYTLQRVNASDGTYTMLISGNVDYSNVYVDNGLEVGTPYSYRFTVYSEGSVYDRTFTASTEAQVSEPAANVLSNQRYGGSGSDVLTSIIRTSDGGYLMGGHSNSGASGEKTEGSQGGADFWIVKTDASGNKQWDKRYGGSGNDLLVEVIQTADGGYMLAGSSNSGISGDKTEASRGGLDYWVVKISANGSKQWDKTLGGNKPDYVGRQEYARWHYYRTYSGSSVIMQTADGGYLLGGTSESSASGDKSENTRDTNDGFLPGDYWVVKLSATGSKQWDKTYGGQGLEEFATLIKTADGYLIGGNSTSLASGEKSENSGGDVYTDFWLIKITANGSLTWDKTLANYGSVSLTKMISTADGGYLLGATKTGLFDVALCYESNGRVMAANYLMKITSNGVIQWTKVFHGDLRNSDESRYNDILNSVIQTQDGGFLLGGTSSSVAGNNGVYGGSGAEFIKSETAYGRAYVASCGYDLATYTSSNDYWVIKVDKDGNHLWNKDLGGFGSDDLQAMLQNPDGSIMLAGSSSSGVDGDKSQPSQGGNDFWLVKLQGSTPPIGTSVVRINAGGPAYTAKSGNVFGADAYFEGNTKTTPFQMYSINNTLDDNLYRTDRVGNVDKGSFRYQIPVSNGQYQVRLHFSENYFKEAGKRVFSVAAEGEAKLVNYDIYASVGRTTAVIKTYPVTVTDGALTLDFSATVNRAKINAIEVLPANAAAREGNELALEEQVSVLQVAPNPFSDQTTLSFQLEETQSAKLELYDLQGKLISTLFEGEVEAGAVQQVSLAGNGLKGGMYIARLVATGQVSYVKILLNR